MEIPKLRSRNKEDHKGTFGRVLIIGGSRGMTGAVSLAGAASARSGAGLVTLAVPDRCLETVASFDPNYMTVPIPDDDQGRFASDTGDRLLALAGDKTSIGIGPGISQGTQVAEVVAEVYRNYSGPMVVDADALNALAGISDGLRDAGGPRVLTPHVGEFRRLVNDSELSAESCRDWAVELAAEHNLIVVLKGHRSLVTDGKTRHENRTGNPGMATGGSGDVLTGVITALLSQELSPFEAAVLGVHVHGLAGDRARDAYGEISMVASDILGFLAPAFKEVGSDRSPLGFAT